jgi:ribosomal protein S6--L-glutamate ligase
MILGVLSRNREYFPTEQLLFEIEKRKDISGVFLSTQFITPLITNTQINSYYSDQSLKSISGIIPRIGRSQTEIGLICLKQFELQGIPTTLSSQALYLARDKFRCYQTLYREQGVLVPKTLLINTPYAFDKLAEIFKYPIVIKIPNATQGAGTILANNQKIAQEIIDALFMQRNTPLIIQEYLGHPLSKSKINSEDIRVLVVDTTILGAMKRIAPKGEWRANYALGATCEPYQLTPDDAEMVLQITKRIGIEVAGIDLYPTDQGMYVLEVNACPGWKAFEETFPHISVAKKIIEYLMVKIRQ